MSTLLFHPTALRPVRSDALRPRALTPRTHYPTVAPHLLRGSPLPKLAWIFGFRR